MDKEKRWVRKVQKNADEIFDSVKDASSSQILADLFKGNHPQPINPPQHAVPDGFEYVAYGAAKSPNSSHEAGLTLAFHAHPSDISSDFASYAIMHTNGFGAVFRQVIATRGEATKAKERLPAGADIISLRLQEEKRSSRIMGIKTEYLASRSGENFPDGRLLDHLPELKERMREYIRANKPRRIILPSPFPDHPDHLAVYIAGMNAITELKKEHFFEKNGKIEIIACEPEFGVAIGQPNALPKIPKAYGGQQSEAQSPIDPGLEFFPYKYRVDKDGRVSPATDITSARWQEEAQGLARFPVAVPPLIVSVNSEMVKRKIAALLQHETQVEGTHYAQLIPALDHLRGMSVGREWGVGIYPIQISGVTADGSSFIDALEPGSVFQLKKAAHARSIDASRPAER